MESIISAIIGGFFTLAAIWLQHYLSKRKQIMYAQSVEQKTKETTPTEDSPRGKTISFKRIFISLIILIIGFITYIAPMFAPGLAFGGSSYLLNFIGGGVMIFGLVQLVSAFKGTAKNG